MIDTLWILAIIGSFLLLAEIFLGTQFFLFFIGIAFYMGALTITLLPQLSFEMSLVLLAFYCCLLPALWFLFVRPHFRNSQQKDDVNHALVGLKDHVLTLEKTMQNGRAKVSIRHSLWDIRSEDGQNFSAGDVVQVVAIDGVTLIVKKLSAS